MHRRLGMTDEAEIGSHLGAAWTAAEMFGTSAFHRERYAELSGY